MSITEAHKLAYSLMIEHGLTAKGWHFDFDRATRRFGATHHSKRLITLSRSLVQLNDIEHVKNTILHEIAHALVGSGQGHNSTWRRQAVAIGCSGSRTYSHEVTKPKAKYKGTCPNCKREINRHRRTQIACGRCCNQYNGGKFNSEYLFVWAVA